MTVTPAQMPENLVMLGFDRHTIAPVVDVTFGALAEGIRGRGLCLESGELIVTPLAPSPIWQGDATAGTEPTIAQPGEGVHLVPGDAMVIPAMDPSEFVPDDGIRFVNPGTVDAVQIGFHLHEQGGGFGNPAGYTY